MSALEVTRLEPSLKMSKQARLPESQENELQRTSRPSNFRLGSFGKRTSDEDALVDEEGDDVTSQPRPLKRPRSEGLANGGNAEKTANASFGSRGK